MTGGIFRDSTNVQQVTETEGEKMDDQNQEGGGDTEKHVASDPMDTQQGADRVDLSGTDQGASNSESSVSFTAKVKDVRDGKTNRGLSCLGSDENSQRFSDRLAPKSDIPIMDRAKNLAKSKNLQTDGGNPYPTVLNSSDSCILEIAELIGIDLSTTLDMVQLNLDLLRGQEQARVNLFLASREDCADKE